MMIATTFQKAGNLLTIDAEDWHQLVGERFTGVDRLYPESVERQLTRLLELLARHRCRATFFCLGRSLAPLPHLVKMIAAAGHEIGTHGWSHRLIFETGLDAFRDDLRRSIDWLTDLTGRAVLGHRAPAFSITADQLQGFYDIAFEAGLRYDSSVFPFRGRRYGLPDQPRLGQVVRRDGDRTLIELPLATVNYAGRRWPVAGGGWWRLLPTRAIQSAVARVNQEGLPFVTYFHPYEFDTQRLSAGRVAGLSLRSLRLSLTQNLGRASVYRKLDAVLGRHKFIAVEDYLHDAGYV